jgi:signal transduction histidine kinase
MAEKNKAEKVITEKGNSEKAKVKGGGDGDKDFLPLAEKAHGIKNILQAISGSMEVVDKALEMKDFDRCERGWGILRANLTKIRALVLSMLEYSREARLVRTNSHFSDFVDSVITTSQAKAQEKNVIIESSFDDDDAIVNVDTDKLHDAILNLILNAIEAVSSDKGRVFVRTLRDEVNGDVILTVEDNGPGLQDTEAIFLPFHSSKKGLNAGLGLSMTRKTVESHGGSIRAENSDEGGAKFVISLPCKKSGFKQSL